MMLGFKAEVDSMKNQPLVSSMIEISSHELLKQIGEGKYGEIWLARVDSGEIRALGFS